MLYSLTSSVCTPPCHIRSNPHYAASTTANEHDLNEEGNQPVPLFTQPIVNLVAIDKNATEKITVPDDQFKSTMSPIRTIEASKLLHFLFL